MGRPPVVLWIVWALLLVSYSTSGRSCCPYRDDPDDPDCHTFTLCCLDVAELSIGVEVLGGVMQPIIPRGVLTPNKGQAMFTTVVDGQTSAVIKVFGGQSELTQHNMKLGELVFNELPATPAGTLQLTVKVDVGYKNITVTAVWMSTNTSKTVTVSREYFMEWPPELNRHFSQAGCTPDGPEDSSTCWVQHIQHYYLNKAQRQVVFDLLHICEPRFGSGMRWTVADTHLRSNISNNTLLINGSKEASRGAGATIPGSARGPEKSSQGLTDLDMMQAAASAALRVVNETAEWLRHRKETFVDSWKRDNCCNLTRDQVSDLVDDPAMYSAQLATETEYNHHIRRVMDACQQLCPYFHPSVDLATADISRTARSSCSNLNASGSDASPAQGSPEWCSHQREGTQCSL